ncbi:MAG TPA: metallophosphoesterase [Bacteroidales bacterium]|nr:metallophosphoesterase [Bacteroidales bacterium]HSA42538.1 metallophosphoesterase [Bacteroidales bacterium]
MSISILLVLSSCDKWFEYSPYSANVPVKMRQTTTRCLNKISEMNSSGFPFTRFKIAFISDSHLNFDDLEDAVEAINRDEEVVFTIHCGDMTDGGMLAEYMISWNIADKLRRPYLTVTGNHDCLANGEYIYQEMFGPKDYSLEFQQCKFVFFTDVIWELNNREPDFLWLDNELKFSTQYRHVFVIAHIPPWSDQFSPLRTVAYRMMMHDHGVRYSVHGHHHDPYLGYYFSDSIPYLVVGSVDKRGYYELVVEQDSCWFNRIQY